MMMMATVAKRGVLLQPHLIKNIDGKSIVIADISKRSKIKLRDDVWQVVLEGLSQTITDAGGTAHILNEINGVQIWGKTGTAQAGRDKENHAWFAGFVKSPKGNYAFCFFLEHGGSSANTVVLTKEFLTQMQSLNLI